MTFTGDELFYLVVVPLIVVLLIFAAFLECKHGKPKDPS